VSVAVPSRRLRVRVTGVVQGVGFRPYVHRLARELRLAGFVFNDERGVVIEVEGDDRALDRFLVRLPAEAPPLAAVESLRSEAAATRGERGFAIVASKRAGESTALVTPDSATCSDCLAELFDPTDRRYRYPFVNCTNCGPRFTIVRGVPYDRPLTTMAGFTMCARCQAEYDDPTDRRFHAQPNACPACGPSVRLVGVDGREASPPAAAPPPPAAPPPAAAALPATAPPRHPDPVRTAAAALREGCIVAIKGLGGYHLACLADDEAAVARLRGRKRREDKPFALIAPDVANARELVELSADAAAALRGRERPIVVAPRRRGARVAAAVAPGSADLGVMLPYTPLHHLLLADVAAPLVLTSGNVSDEPIAYADDEALERLAPIADRFLVHDRPIHMRTDDSVVRATRAGGVMLRRSRGYVPASVDLPHTAPPLLACGAELKSTFCVAKGRRAWVSHHIGDLKNWETLRSYREGIEHFERLFAVTPEVVVHDLHPDYLSTAYAQERDGVELVAVQHHHAHLAACLAEHGVDGPAVAAIFDGSGYGTDGGVWGGELLVGDLIGFERVGHLHPVRLPGGDRAVHEPWRMACAWLVAAGAASDAPPATLRAAVDDERWQAVAELARSGTAAPTTTSVGRLFDAIAALAGLRARVTHEGQAAMELEAVADPSEASAYPLPCSHPASADADGRLAPAVAAPQPPLRLDARPTILAALRDAELGTPAGMISARFHNALADATAAACAAIAEERAMNTAVLSGGVFQNRLLLERVAAALRATGLRVLTPRMLPPNDGGVAYGQAAVVAAKRGS
jgi:hydrogenase maturation protein HypF